MDHHMTLTLLQIYSSGLPLSKNITNKLNNYTQTMGHFIFGLHQRLTLKFNTKPLIQSPKIGVKPFCRLDLV